MKKVIKFIKDVYCCDEYCSRPDKVHIVLSPELVKRILMLAKEVKRLGVYTITEFDYTPDWKETGVKEPDWDVNCVILNVSNDSFHYDGHIKHTNITFESDRVSLKHLKAKVAKLKGAK